MTTLTAPKPDSTATQGPPGGARLRVRREGRADQSIAIEGGKCTIGSSPRCHVRLPASESQPLQCLLSLEAGAAIATRWASGVLLNGRTFAKEEFQAGDTLSIGPWEIEWEGREAAPRRPAPKRETPEREAIQRETVDFTPPPAPPTAPAPTPTPNLRSTEPFIPSPPAVAPAAPTRPAAKTLLISSRETDPFTDLLGPAKPIAAATAPVAPQPEVIRPTFTSQAFEDRLVAKLWTSNYSARRRAKSLATAARTARARAGELTTAILEAESHLASDRTLNETATLELRTQMESLASELKHALAERDRVEVELEALRNARPLTAPPDPRLQMLADASAQAEREAAELRDTLAACNEQIELLREQSSAAESALLAATAAQAVAEKSQSLTEQQLAQSQLAHSQLIAEERQLAEERQRAALLAEQEAREHDRSIAEQEAAELREALAACNEQIATLHAECAAAETALTAATAAQAAADKAKADAERQLAESRLVADKGQTEALLAEQIARAQQKLLADQEAAELRNSLAASNEQIEALREQCTEAEAALATATAARVSAEKAQSAAAEQLAELQAAADERQSAALAAETKSREQERLIADQEAARLREQLYACETQIETLRGQLAEVDAERTTLDDRLAALQAQQDEWLAQCKTLEHDRAATLAEVTSERDELQNQLDALASRAAAAVSALPSVVDWPTPAAPPAAERPPAERPSSEIERETPVPTQWHGAVDADLIDDDETPSLDYADIVSEADVPESVAVEEKILAAPPKATPAPEAPAAPFAPPSFIDKYRHLLDDDGESEPPLSSSRPILDEEHLSPAKSMPTAGHDEDSDEALEAYMSNMMRRVRGDGSSPASQAHSEPASPRQPVASTPEVTINPVPAEDEPEIEVDANGMLRLARKPHAATDIAALRELANNSARTAIAHHHKRRHVQSAVTKSVICVIASAASAYLMLTATGVDSPWFWGGCVTLVMAVASAGQLAVLAFQRLAEWRRSPAKPATPTAAASTAFAQEEVREAQAPAEPS